MILVCQRMRTQFQQLEVLSGASHHPKKKKTISPQPFTLIPKQNTKATWIGKLRVKTLADHSINEVSMPNSIHDAPKEEKPKPATGSTLLYSTEATHHHRKEITMQDIKPLQQATGSPTQILTNPLIETTYNQ